MKRIYAVMNSVQIIEENKDRLIEVASLISKSCSKNESYRMYIIKDSKEILVCSNGKVDEDQAVYVCTIKQDTNADKEVSNSTKNELEER